MTVVFLFLRLEDVFYKMKSRKDSLIVYLQSMTYRCCKPDNEI